MFWIFHCAFVVVVDVVSSPSVLLELFLRISCHAPQFHWVRASFEVFFFSFLFFILTLALHSSVSSFLILYGFSSNRFSTIVFAPAGIIRGMVLVRGSKHKWGQESRHQIITSSRLRNSNLCCKVFLWGWWGCFEDLSLGFCSGLF